MAAIKKAIIFSDIHFAGTSEQRRSDYERRAITNPLLRSLAKAYRFFFWLRDPFAHNHRLDTLLQHSGEVDWAIANGDYSCDTGFIGVSDPAAMESATICLEKLRERFGDRLYAGLGDHELGKKSFFGGRGGMRLASWQCAQKQLRLQPMWRIDAGHYVLLGITSSLVALPVYESDTLPEERAQWNQLRMEHMAAIAEIFAQLSPSQRLILFAHDPTCLPFLWAEASVRAKAHQIERTVIGHLHSNLILWKSRRLAGMPSVRFLGNTIRRMTTALNQARHWEAFHVLLCPSLSGIQLLKDGGYLTLTLDTSGSSPAKFEFHPIRWDVRALPTSAIKPHAESYS